VARRRNWTLKPAEHVMLTHYRSYKEIFEAERWVNGHTTQAIDYRTFRRRMYLGLRKCGHCLQMRMHHAGKKCLFEPTYFEDGGTDGRHDAAVR
jgi:hypothetical protein